MAKYESSVKELAYSQQSVYNKLSDLTHLESIRQRLDDPNLQAQMAGKVSEEQLAKAKEQIEKMKLTADELSIELPMMGELQVKVVERTPDKCVKFQSVKSPVPFTFWVQVVPFGEAMSKLKLTIDASLNPFIRPMVEKPLKQGLEKVADMLAMIPYE